MAILKVAQMGHPVLREIAKPVDPQTIKTKEFQQFCEDMLETMDEYDGAGLAAPQVHQSTRVVVLALSHGEEPEVWINPVLTPLTDEMGSMVEGCLSVAGLRGRVQRPIRLHVSFVDRNADHRAYILQGFPAVVAQHECDHLDGILYVDRVDSKSLAFLSEYSKFGFEPLPDDSTTADVLDSEDAVIEVPASLSTQQALQAAAEYLESATLPPSHLPEAEA